MDNDGVLENIVIAKPCSADWSQMVGDDRVRLCGQCNKNVYNIAEMSKLEAIELMSANGEAPLPCMRLYYRKDGTVMTDDCPKALKAVRNAVRRTQAVVAGLVSVLMSCLPSIAQTKGSDGARRATMGEVSVSHTTNSSNTGTPDTGTTPGGNDQPRPLMGAPVPIRTDLTRPPKPVVQQYEWIGVLKSAGTVDDSAIGDGGEMSPTYSAFKKAYSQGLAARTGISRLLHTAGPAGKFYAGLLLLHIDRSAGQRALEQLKFDPSTVVLRSGCDVESVPLSKLAGDALSGLHTIKLP